jgi:acetyl-CoA C-acetyltransferase
VGFGHHVIIIALSNDARGTRLMARPTPTPAPTPGVRQAYVLGGNRIPFARAGGPYVRASNQDMLTAAIDGLVARYGLQGERIG